MEKTFAIERLDSGLVLTDDEGKRIALATSKDAGERLVTAFADMIKPIHNGSVKNVSIKINVEETP